MKMGYAVRYNRGGNIDFQPVRVYLFVNDDGVAPKMFNSATESRFITENLRAPRRMRLIEELASICAAKHNEEHVDASALYRLFANGVQKIKGNWIVNSKQLATWIAQSEKVAA